MVTVTLDAEALRPLIQQIVQEVMRAGASQPSALPPDRLAFPEREAARMLGVERHVLRDARLRGELTGNLCGKKIIYSRDALLQFVGK
jgi:hypothetical protein